MKDEIIIQIITHPLTGQLHALTDMGRVLYWSVTNMEEVQKNHDHDEDIKEWGWVEIPNSNKLPAWIG